MAIQVDYPGVYIEEFAPGAPIQGVGTSTAAFLGPAADGPLNQPVKLTTWDAFLARYGSAPRDAQDYLWYAVRGFFQNNGKVCYILRVSNADYDRLPLPDRSSSAALVARARVAGNLSARPISIQVAGVNAQTTKIFRHNANLVSASGNNAHVATAAHAAGFRPGDRVTISQGTNSETMQVLRVVGDQLRLASTLTGTYDNTATIRLADLRPGMDDSFRIRAGDKIFPGSVLTLTQGTTVSETVVVKTILTERISNALTTYRVTTVKPVSLVYDLTNDVDVVSQDFTVTVTQNNEAPPHYTKIYANLSMEPGSRFFYASEVNNDPHGRIFLEEVQPPNTTAHPNNRPADLAATALTGGAADNPATLTPVDYENALRRLEAIDDINLVLAPGQTSGAVQNALKEHCEKMKDRFAILESHRGAPPFGSGNGSVEEQRGGLDSPNGYAALYYPWLQVTPADGKGQLLVPPGGHVAGIIARTDNNRGVFKAPAGLEAIVNGARGVDTVLSDTDHGQLNLKGINVIRVFQSGGLPVVWGARTTATNTNWQYVNIRRLFLFLEESIQEGIRWAVFEPNNTGLWAKLRRSIGAFLMQQWRDGALFGETPEKAFYVRIDEALNPFTEQQLGRLYIEIGVRPSYPAEFIIVRIGIWDGGSEVSE